MSAQFISITDIAMTVIAAQDRFIGHAPFW
jgi:hypothetical protein